MLMVEGWGDKLSSMDDIDITFDFRSDTPPGKDPDALSPTLRRYHKFLWTKPLPGGTVFELMDSMYGAYLHHSSELGEFWLASDAVIPSFRKESRLSQVIEQIPEKMAEFIHIGYTIGGMMLFPQKRIEGKMTINGARGFHPRIKDRFDLTLECIRLHYIGKPSPLESTLGRYGDYFSLFCNFQGFAEFFLLQDMIRNDSSAVEFFTPFDNFNSSPVPDSMAAYLSYREQAIGFINARNQRIQKWQETKRAG